MTPQFQPGDRVRISGISSADANCEGLLGTYKKPDINDFHVVHVDDHGRTRSFRAHQLTKLPAQNPKFPVGVKVRIIGYSYSDYAPHGLIGQIGTVRINTFTSAAPEDYCYIIDGVGPNNLFREDELELAIDTYKEGDRVKILHDNNAPMRYVGQIGTVVKTHKTVAGFNPFYMSVRFDDGGDTWNYHAYDVERVTGAPNKIEIEAQGSDLFATAINTSQAVNNDLLVYCKRFAGECLDDQALVRKAIAQLNEGTWPRTSMALASIGNKLSTIDRTCRDEARWWATAAVLEHFWTEMFSPKEETPVAPQFKEGDQVRILASSYPGPYENPVGKVGTIVDTDWRSTVDKKYRYVVSGVGGQNLYAEGEFELVKQAKFKIGDRVVLTTVDDEDRYDDPEQDPVNFPGTVTKVDPEFVVVDWDKGAQDNVCWFENSEGETVRLLADVQAERWCAAEKPVITDVIVLVTFCNDEKKTPKAYEYRAARHLGIQPGDVLAVDTPYGNNKHITVQDVYELDRQMFKGTLKHIKKRVRKGNPQKFVPMYQRDAFHDVQQEGRGLVGRQAIKLLVDDVDLSPLEQRVLDAMSGLSKQALLYGKMMHQEFGAFAIDSIHHQELSTMYKITKPTLVNGTDVKNVTDDQLIGMIDANAQALESLRKQNERVQTKVLEQRIAKLQRDTDELRALLDSRYVADETPTDAAE